jgi:hypothetical protein
LVYHSTVEPISLDQPILLLIQSILWLIIIINDQSLNQSSIILLSSLVLQSSAINLFHQSSYWYYQFSGSSIINHRSLFINYQFLLLIFCSIINRPSLQYLILILLMLFTPLIPHLQDEVVGITGLWFLDTTQVHVQSVHVLPQRARSVRLVLPLHCGE